MLRQALRAGLEMVRDLLDADTVIAGWTLFLLAPRIVFVSLPRSWKRACFCKARKLARVRVNCLACPSGGRLFLMAAAAVVVDSFGEGVPASHATNAAGLGQSCWQCLNDLRMGPRCGSAAARGAGSQDRPAWVYLQCFVVGRRRLRTHRTTVIFRRAAGKRRRSIAFVEWMGFGRSGGSGSARTPAAG